MTTQPQPQKRVRWARPADFAWGAGATFLTLALVWVLLRAPATTAAPPVVTEPSGGATAVAGSPVIVAGNAAPNQPLKITGNGATVGEVRSGADGSFRYEVRPLEPGTYEVAVNAVDSDGNELAASTPVQITVTEARVPQPVAVLADDQMPRVAIPEGGLRFDASAPGLLQGTGLPGSNIVLLNGADQIATAPVDAGGNWSVQLPQLSLGEHFLTVKQILPDGTEAVLPEPVEVAVSGLKGPQLAVPVGGLAFPTGQPVTLEGTGAPGAAITVSGADGTPLGSTTADSSGEWKMTLPALAPGSYQLTVKQTTAEGQEAQAVEPITLTVGAPAPPAAPSSESVASLAVTSPTVGTVQPAGQPVTLDGTGAPGATITIQGADGVPLGVTTADAAGRWTVTLPAPAPGTYQVTIKQTTGDGQEAQTAQPLVLTVGASPTDGQSALTASPIVTAPLAGAALPADQPVTLKGTGTPGATITVVGSDGSQLGTTTVDSSGVWTQTLPALQPGTYQMTVKQVTAEGQETTSAAALTVRIGATEDSSTTTLPAAAVSPSVISPSAGAVQPAGRPLTLEGAGAPGATITVSAADGKPIGTAAVTGDGRWTLTLPGLAPGSYQFSVKQATADGQDVQMAETLALSVGASDAALPSITQPGTDVNVNAGASLPLKGLGTPGATVVVSEGSNALAEAMVDDAGAWALNLPALSLGLHELSVAQTTQDGAASEAIQPLIVTIVASDATSAAAAPGDWVRGTAPAGSTVELYSGTTLVGRTQAGADGVWQVELAAGAPSENSAFTIKALDAAGNPLNSGTAVITGVPPATLPVTGGGPHSRHGVSSARTSYGEARHE